MPDCIFCRIASGDIPSRVVFSDDEIMAFEDVNPQAPVHVLVIPRKHVPTLNDLTEEDDAILGRMHRTAVRIARERGVSGSGYRLVLNCNAHAGQSVWHIHVHLLGGRVMQWPPG